MPAAAGIADIAGLFGAGAAEAAPLAADAGALGVLDAGLLGGAVPGAVADVGALGAADLGAGAAATDLGLGAAGLGDVASTAPVGESLFAAGSPAALAGGADLTGLTGVDALSALGTTGSDFASTALGPQIGADVAAATPGATSLGGLNVGALGGATGAPMSATGALEAASDPSAILDIAGTGDPTFEPAGATTAFGGGNVLGGGLPNLPPNVGGAPQIPGTFGQSPLLPSPTQTSGFVPTTTGSPLAGGGAAAGGGDIGAAAAPLAAPAAPAPAVPAAATGGGGLFGTGISGKDAALYGLAGAPLAMALLQGQPSVPPQTQQSTAVSPAEQAFAQQMIASGGAPNAYQSAQIAQNSQNRLNQYRQILFNQGVQNPQADSRWPAFVQADQQQQEKEMVAFQQQNMNEAFAAAGGAQSALANAGNVQAQQDTAYTTAWQNAMKSATTALALGGAFGTKVQPTVNVA
jgi:hypothetical protein